MSNQDLKRQLINPPHTQVLYDTYHFSQANRVGNIVWVSGQVGIDANFVPGADITEQAHLAFQALRGILEEAGGSLADVVELITFHTDLQGEVHAFGQVKDEYFPDRYAAWLRGYRDAWANVTGTGLKTSAELSPDGNGSPLG